MRILCLHRRRQLCRAGLLLCVVAMMAACSAKPSFENLDLSGNTAFGQNFSVPDTDGKTRTMADYKGRLVVLVFGYTHCPDVCPTTLADLAQAVQQLGAAGSQVQVLFVTVDPERDNPTLLAQYLHAFNPHFVGLVPQNEAQLKQITGDFRIYHAKARGATPADYTVDHTAASYVFDQQGQLRLYVKDAQGAPPWVHDLQLLLQH
jgi:protein SCO1/2